jgi:hypothetical protein
MFTQSGQLHIAFAADTLSSLRCLGHGYRSSSAMPVSFCLWEGS